MSGESGYPSRISLSTSIKGKTSLGGENEQGYGRKQRILRRLKDIRSPQEY